MGKAAFLDLRDEFGRIQLYFKRDHLGQERFAQLDLVDLGDFVGVEGTLFRTRTGEITVEAAGYHGPREGPAPAPVPEDRRTSTTGT